ncbi:MAG: hypothetical protein U1F56_04615 [Rubrivivax sp.]
MPQGRLIRAACAAALLALPAAAPAQPFSAELGLGRQSLSAPLVRIDERSPVLRIDGLQRLSGTYLAASLSGLHDLPFAGGVLALSARADGRHAPVARDLGFAAANADAIVRWPLPGVTLGAGVGLQRLWVAGRPFRRAAPLQAEATLSTPGDDGHLALFASHARQRHPGDFADFDGVASAATLQRRWARPMTGLSAIELEVGVGRERNDAGHADLSEHHRHLRAAVSTALAGVEFTLGHVWQRARFDAPLLDGLPARRDRLHGWDLAAAAELTAGLTLRLEVQRLRNAANLALFDSREQGWALTLAAQR